MLENVVCEMVSILSRPQCVNTEYCPLLCSPLRRLFQISSLPQSIIRIVSWGKNYTENFHYHSLTMTNAGYRSVTDYFHGSVQDCSISIALAIGILQSCTKPPISDTPALFQASYRMPCVSISGGGGGNYHHKEVQQFVVYKHLILP